jgi:hypothetical protein
MAYLPCPNTRCPSRRRFAGEPIEQKDGSWKCRACKRVTAKHTHRWRRTGFMKTIVVEACSVAGCGKRRERAATLVEAKQIHETFQRMLYPGRADNMHFVWHEFAKKFMKDRGGYRWQGYDLMQRIERWSKKYPDQVTICRVDDDMFMGADLVLIGSCSTHQWMGINVVYVTQGSGEPSHFFLYPQHVAGLLHALQLSQVKAKRLDRAHVAWRKKARKKNPFVG